MQATVGDLTLTYETHGDPSDAPLLLISGLGAQLLMWDEGFVDELVKRGFFVVRFDNRDIGLSTYLDDQPILSPQDALSAGPDGVPYSLLDMAADAAGLLDALGIEAAHIVGASMGGMIAQQFAIDFPHKTLSLTSIMSTTGDRSVGAASPEAAEALRRPAPSDPEAALTQAIEASRVWSSPRYPVDEAALRAKYTISRNRSDHPAGMGRQLAAIYASPDRTPGLRNLSVPALVVHGDSDTLVNVTGGEATAAAIPGSRLVIHEGMGHDLPAPLWAVIADDIAALTSTNAPTDVSAS